MSKELTLESLNCVETTSKTQKRNGTRRFKDPLTGCDYLSYSNGYIRRSYSTTYWNSNKRRQVTYQLNPTRNFKDCRERVMICCEDKRLESLAKAVVNFRKNSLNTTAQH